MTERIVPIIRILNLFAGIGGNTYLLDRDKYQITHVENNETIAAINQKLNPDDTIIIQDAFEYIHNYDNYDIIWASPPCQTHTIMNRALHHQDKRTLPDLKFYSIIKYLQAWSLDKKWIVENVIPFYEPLIEPNYEFGRHLYWSNFRFYLNPIPRDFNYVNGRTSTQLTASEFRNKLVTWLELPTWLKETKSVTSSNSGLQHLTNCVHPKEGLQIFNQLSKGPIDHLEVFNE